MVSDKRKEGEASERKESLKGERLLGVVCG